MISVIIPVYNREHLIGETIKSLLNQTTPAEEIIVVDDGSTDGTANAAREAFEERKSKTGGCKTKLKLIYQKNKGPAAARNAGFESSTGEFIHFFDSDDIALPNKHEFQLRALQKSGADIAYGPWIKGSFNGYFFCPDNQVLQQRGIPKADLVKALLTNWSIVPHACLFRRSIVEKSGGFPPHLFYAEDQMMFLNCLLAGGKVVHSPGTLELYRENDLQKITAPKNNRKRQIKNWARFLIDADAVCRQNGFSPSKWFGFRQRAWEGLEDFEIFGVDQPELSEGLQAIFNDGTPTPRYKWHRQLERWRGGLQQRLTGGRATNDFRIGKLTNEQIVLINDSGYNLADKSS